MITEKEKKALEHIMYWTGKKFSGDAYEAQHFIRSNIDEARENKWIDERANRRGI